MDKTNDPDGVSIRTKSGSIIPFSSIACDEFAAHGSDVGIGPIWKVTWWADFLTRFSIDKRGSHE
jgi:hypothetical protein